MSVGTVALYGATGFTGRLIAARLAERGQPFVVGGRNRERLESLADELEADHGIRPSIVAARVEKPEALDAMLTGVDVLINCAGPFADFGKPVVEAALRNHVHYLDTTGEQEHIEWVERECHQPAAARELVMLPACAFEFALGDMAAEIALARAASRIVVAYAAGTAKMSHGTKKSLMRSLAQPGLTFIHGAHHRKRTGYRLFDVPFPDGSFQKGVWVAGGEALTVPRRGGVSTVETCVVDDGGLAHMVAPLLGVVAPVVRLMQPLIDWTVGKTSADPHQAQKSQPQFWVIAFDPKTCRPHITLMGVDMYVTTAKIAVEAATRLLDEQPIKTGFVGPADLFNPADFLGAVDVEICESE